MVSRAACGGHHEAAAGEREQTRASRSEKVISVELVGGGALIVSELG